MKIKIYIQIYDLLKSILSELFSERLNLFGLGTDLVDFFLNLNFSLMERFGFLDSFLFEFLDQLSLVPSDGLAELSKKTELSSEFESHNFEGLWNVSFLNVGIRIWASLEDLKSLKSSFSSWGLMRKHSSDSSPEEFGRSLEMVWSTLSWVAIGDLILPFEIFNSSVVEESTEDDLFSSNNNDLLSAE
jgi:hypothetical protein